MTKFGEGDGIPLQYSCLENPMDGGAWLAAVHGVAKSRTRLSNFTFTFHFHALEKEMATHSSVLAWRIPGTVETGGLPSMGSHRAGHDWSDLAAAAAMTKLSIFIHECLTTIDLFSLVNCFLVLVFELALYVLDTCPLSVMCFADILSLCAFCFCHIVFFTEHLSFLNFWWSSVFVFCDCVLGFRYNNSA